MIDVTDISFDPIEKKTSIAFYVIAHADDWQLFMQPDAYHDLVAEDRKVVFIVITAGDAGLGEKHWRSREEGMKSSIHFCLAPLTSVAEKSSMFICREHVISVCSLNNARCYFLRLPDGNLNGEGFTENRGESLQKCKTGKSGTITAVDQSAVYLGWDDLVKTIQSVIEREMAQSESGSIGYLDPDIQAGTSDHPDHICTGEAIRKMTPIPALQHKLFKGYPLSADSHLLQGTDLFWKIGMFSAYEKKVYEETGYSTLRESVTTYQDWCLSAPVVRLFDHSKHDDS